jgi:hypothetical protein
MRTNYASAAAGVFRTDSRLTHPYDRHFPIPGLGPIGPDPDADREAEP